MGEAVLAAAGRRWKRLVEVAVRRPARGFIDVVLVDPVEPAIVAVDSHSTSDDRATGPLGRGEGRLL